MKNEKHSLRCSKCKRIWSWAGSHNERSAENTKRCV